MTRALATRLMTPALLLALAACQSGKIEPVRVDLAAGQQAVIHGGDKSVRAVKVTNGGPGDVQLLTVSRFDQPVANLVLHPRSSYEAVWESINHMVIANASAQSAELEYQVKGSSGAAVQVQGNPIGPESAAR